MRLCSRTSCPARCPTTHCTLLSGWRRLCGWVCWRGWWWLGGQHSWVQQAWLQHCWLEDTLCSAVQLSQLDCVGGRLYHAIVQHHGDSKVSAVAIYGRLPSLARVTPTVWFVEHAACHVLYLGWVLVEQQFLFCCAWLVRSQLPYCWEVTLLYSTYWWSAACSGCLLV